MGIYGSMVNGGMDFGLGLGNILTSFDEADRRQKPMDNYYDNTREQRAREQRLDYTPAYVGDSIGPYRRSSSPVARAYLESMMTGQNKQAAASPWADPAAGQHAESSFENTYGPYEALVARGAREREATPWATTRPKPVDQSADDAQGFRYDAYSDEGDKQWNPDNRKKHR